MTKIDHEKIAMSIWRSGYVQDKNKIRQRAKEYMRQLIATDIATELIQEDKKFDRKKFMKACGIGY